jgi:hypothetical protein
MHLGCRVGPSFRPECRFERKIMRRPFKQRAQLPLRCSHLYEAL